MSKTLQNLTDRLYDGLLHPDHWAEALKLLCQALDGVAFHHFTVRKPGLEVLTSLTSDNVPPQKLAEYENHLVHLDPRMAWTVQTPMGEVMWDHEHLSAAEIDRHPVYAEFLQPLGLRHTMAIPLRDEGDTREVLAILRPHDHRPYDLAHSLLVRQLLPDLHRVAGLRYRLQRLDRDRTLTQPVWDAMRVLPHAVMLVDGQCRLQYANPAAERLLSRDPPASPSLVADDVPEDAPEAPQAHQTHGLLRSRQGRLECDNPTAQETLERLVSAACTDVLALPLPARVGSFWLQPAESSPTQRTVVNVLPMPRGEGGSASRWALVMVSTNQRHHGLSHIDPKTLGAALQLTPAETRLALLLAQGRTLKDFALQESISWHTARTHVKNLMRKTNVSRQAELIQLLRNMLAA